LGRPHAKTTDGLPAAGAYRIDPFHSFALFAVKHLIVGRVDGRFNAIEGSFVVTHEPERLFDRVEVNVEAASIDTNFELRDEDLRGPRFFDVTKHPSLRFRGDTSRRTGDNGWVVVGEFTIRDVTRQVSFDVELRGMTVDQRGQSKLGASATAVLERINFDLTTELEMESGAEGGPDVWVRLDIEAILQRRD